MPHLSALENVLVGQHCRNRGFFGVLQPVNLMPAQSLAGGGARGARTRPGLATYERATVGSLPYGVQKRIELVRALMAQPRLLLLDEPAAGLNPAETDALRSAVATICRDRGITLLVVEHDMHFVGALCEQVIVLNFGRKIAEGTPEDMRAGRRWFGSLSRQPHEPRKRRSAMRLEVHDLHVRYGRVHAVRGVSLSVGSGRDRRGARRQRRGQVVAAQGAAGARADCRRPGHVRRRRHHALADEPAGAQRPRAGAGGPPHRDEPDGARKSADGRVRAQAICDGRRARSPKSMRAFRTWRRGGMRSPRCCRAASSRCWRSAAGCWPRRS